MKNKKANRNGLVHVIGSFGKAAPDDGEFFDDCEICTMLKKQKEAGLINIETVNFDEEDDDSTGVN